MRVGGWKPFWAALLAALLLFLPLAGGTVLLTRHRLRAQLRQAAQSQSGVPVRLPREENRLTLLVCTADEDPTFALLYLNAAQNCVHVLTLPAGLAVPFGEGEQPLRACYAAAGPARCREALTEAFALPEDTRYLALSPALLAKLAAPLGPLRVSLRGAVPAEVLAGAALPDAVQEWEADEARAQIAALPAEYAPAAHAAVWDAFFRQKLELLPGTLPQALRQNSGALLTDLTAPELLLLEETLEFLANNAAPVQSGALPAQAGAEGAYLVTDASRAAVQAFFNSAPASAQAASGSAP